MREFLVTLSVLVLVNCNVRPKIKRLLKLLKSGDLNGSYKMTHFRFYFDK